jgi:hypothetical protein
MDAMIEKSLSIHKKGKRLKYTTCLTLYLFLILLLGACGGGDAAKPSTDDNPANQPSATPLSNQDRIATAAVLSQQTPTIPVEPPTVTPPPTPNYDPGPYFTPRRQSPLDPATFVPDEQVGDFTRVEVSGNCLRTSGQSSRYMNTDGEVIYLTCQFMDNPLQAYNVIASITQANVLMGDPIMHKLQDNESFVLGATGEGFLYGWTHRNWLFLARSPLGREALDDFMQAFPY